jgi:hypothetical protein
LFYDARGMRFTVTKSCPVYCVFVRPFLLYFPASSLKVVQYVCTVDGTVVPLIKPGKYRTAPLFFHLVHKLSVVFSSQLLDINSCAGKYQAY